MQQTCSKLQYWQCWHSCCSLPTASSVVGFALVFGGGQVVLWSDPHPTSRVSCPLCCLGSSPSSSSASWLPSSSPSTSSASCAAATRPCWPSGPCPSCYSSPCSLKSRSSSPRVQKVLHGEDLALQQITITVRNQLVSDSHRKIAPTEGNLQCLPLPVVTNSDSQPQSDTQNSPLSGNGPAPSLLQ